MRSHRREISMATDLDEFVIVRLENRVNEMTQAIADRFGYIMGLHAEEAGELSEAQATDILDGTFFSFFLSFFFCQHRCLGVWVFVFTLQLQFFDGSTHFVFSCLLSE
jgi:hypothetical protein